MNSSLLFTYAGHYDRVPDSPPTRYACLIPADLHEMRCYGVRVVALLPAYVSTLDLTVKTQLLHVDIALTPRRAIHERQPITSPRQRAATFLRWHFVPRRVKEVLRGLDATLVEVDHMYEPSYVARRQKQPRPDEPLVQRATISIPRRELRDDPPRARTIEEFLNAAVDRDTFTGTRIAYRLTLAR